MYASTIFRGFAVLLCLAAPAAKLAGAEATTSTTAATADQLYAAAVKHYSDRHWQSAVDEFTRLLQTYPDHAQAASALFFRAEAQVQQGKHADARQGYLAFAQREPDHRFAPQARFRAAEAVYLAGDVQTARAELETFVADYPDSPLNLYAQKYLAELALAARDGPRAAALFQTILERYPDGPQVEECRFGLGRALELQGDIEAARIAYQTMAAAQSLLADDAQVQLGICLYNHGNYGPAAKAFQAALDRFPDSDLTGQARYWLGMCHVAQREWDQAARTLQDALDRHPQHALAPSMTFWLADAKRQAGVQQAAQEGYAKVLKDWPECEWADDSLEMLTQFAWAESQFEQVVVLGEQFRKQYPASPLKDQVEQRLGRAYLKQKQYAQAIGVLKPLTAAADDDDDGGTAADAGSSSVRQMDQYYLGLAYLGAEQYAEALEALGKVGEAAASPEVSGGVRLAQALACTRLNRPADAIEPLQQYLAAQPAGPEAAACRIQLIQALMLSGRVGEALLIHREVADLQPPPAGFEAVTLQLAEAALEAGKYDDAAELFGVLAEERQPPEWACKGWSGLGWTRFRAGKPEQALLAFTRLLDRYPDNSLAPEAGLMKAKTLEQLDRRAEALDAYLLVVTTYASSEYAAPAMLEAARLQETLGKSAEAVPLLRRLVQEHPDFAQLDAALYQLAWLLDEQGQAAEAGRLFERISEQYPDGSYWADTTYRLAERASRIGQYDRARTYADRLIAAKCPPEVLMHALYLRGQVAASTQRWRDVTGALTALLDQFPDSPLGVTAECWIAEACYQQKDFAAAAARFAKLAQDQRVNDATWTAMIPLRRAQILAEQQKWDEACELAGGISGQFPDFGKQYEADYVLGLCRSKQGKPTEAIEHYERVIRSPEGGRTETAAKAQWMIGEAYAAQCEFEQALKAYDRVESLYSYPQWQAAALVQAGKCRELQQDYPNAALAWKQVLSRFPRTPSAAEAARRLERLDARLAAAAPKVAEAASKLRVPPPRTGPPASRATLPAPNAVRPGRAANAPASGAAATSANIPAVHLRTTTLPFQSATPPRQPATLRSGTADAAPPHAVPNVPPGSNATRRRTISEP